MDETPVAIIRVVTPHPTDQAREFWSLLQRSDNIVELIYIRPVEHAIATKVIHTPITVNIHIEIEGVTIDMAGVGHVANLFVVIGQLTDFLFYFKRVIYDQ